MLADVLSDIVAWMETLSPLMIYVTVFAVAYFENVIPPIPGDMIVVFGGTLVGLGRVEFVPVVALATIAGTLGFMTMYAVGRRVGDAVLDPERLRWIPKRAARKVRDWLRRWGYGVVAANRFLSGARSVIALMVGAARMHPGPTALWATVSAAVWTGILAYLGLVLGDNWAVIGDWLKRYSQWVTLALVVALVFYVGVGRWRKHIAAQRNGEDPLGQDSSGSGS